MIDKKTFVDTMNWLTQLDEKMNAVDKAMRALDPDCCSFYAAEFVEMVVDFMVNAMEDTSLWIPFFTYECNFLRDTEDRVRLNDEVQSITTWEQVYDFMVTHRDDE